MTCQAIKLPRVFNLEEFIKLPMLDLHRLFQILKVEVLPEDLSASALLEAAFETSADFHAENFHAENPSSPTQCKQIGLFRCWLIPYGTAC